MHKFGTPAYRLEAHLQNVAKLLQIEASFMVTPTALTFVLSNEESQDFNYHIRVKPGDLNLGALARTDQLVDELETGQRTLSGSD